MNKLMKIVSVSVLFLLVVGVGSVYASAEYMFTTSKSGGTITAEGFEAVPSVMILLDIKDVGLMGQTDPNGVYAVDLVNFVGKTVNYTATKNLYLIKKGSFVVENSTGWGIEVPIKMTKMITSQLQAVKKIRDVTKSLKKKLKIPYKKRR